MAGRGRPVGSLTDKAWSDAIRIAAFRRDKKSDPQAIQLAAEKLLECAIAGDVSAMKEIGDRLDGKPTQPNEHTVKGNLNLTVVTAVDNDNG